MPFTAAGINYAYQNGRTINYGNTMVMNIHELVSDVVKLLSLPEVCIRVNEMVDDPNVSVTEIGKVVNQDPALTARILKIANSPLYGFAMEIDTVSKAVTVLGTRQIRDLVLATVATRVFDGMSNELVTMENFWVHSIYCGLAAQLLAAECRKGRHESLFISGLLHDIGRLIIYNKIPGLAREALQLSLEGSEELEMHLAERKVIGFDHAQVGGELARSWKLPVNLQECIEFHHEPARAIQFPMETAIVHIANSVACMAELNTTNDGEIPMIEPISWEITGLSNDIIESVMQRSQAQIAEIKSMLSIGS